MAGCGNFCEQGASGNATPRNVVTHSLDEPIPQSEVTSPLGTAAGQMSYWVTTPDDALAWFARCSDADACKFIELAHEARGRAFRVVKELPDSSNTTSNRIRSREGDGSMANDAHDRIVEDAARALADVPIVQFVAPICYCKPRDEDSITLDIIRIGNLKGKSVIEWKTIDGSAKAGQKYLAAAGTIQMEEDEHVTSIEIELVPTTKWDTTTEFSVQLLETNLEGAHLGKYLYISRVKVINDTPFPSEKVAKLAEKTPEAKLDMQMSRSKSLTEKVAKLKKWAVMRGYVRLCFSNPVIRRGTLKMLLVRMYRAIYFLGSLCIEVWLIDRVLKLEANAWLWIFIAATGRLPFFAFLHFIDHRELTWKVAGTARGMLHLALCRKFLNYNEQARASLMDGELLVAIVRESETCVFNGYMKVLAIVEQLFRFLAMLVFIFGIPLVMHGDAKGIDWLALLTLWIFPIGLVGLLFARADTTKTCAENRNRSQVELIGQASRITENYELIAGYQMRPFFEARCEARIAAYNKAFTAAGIAIRNNVYATKWVTALATAAYTYYGGRRYTAGEMELGIFIAGLSLIKRVGDAAGNLYKALLDMELALPLLTNIMNLVNKPLEPESRRAMSKSVRKRTIQCLTTATQQEQGGRLPVDDMPISVQTYEVFLLQPSSPNGLGKDMLEVHQGALVGFVGPEGEGKGTLLKLIGGRALPGDASGVIVPSHLRVVHIPGEPMFFQGTLCSNLTFGATKGDPDASDERVLKICQALGVRAEIIDSIQKGDDGPVESWKHVLSASQKSILSIARALVMNPEVLCLHRPEAMFDEQASTRIVRVLKTYCEEKGLCQDASLRHWRRPRTCFFTPCRSENLKMCDKVYHISRTAGLQEYDGKNGEGSLQV